MKAYNSKRAIYDDYEIAVKFRLKYDVSRDTYKRFFDALRANDNWRITEFNCEVHHLNTHYSTSVGLFAEVPVKNDDGTEIGVRLVLLEHESGPEFFLSLDPLVVAAGTFLVTAASGKIKEAVVKKAMSAVNAAIRDRWPTHAMRIESPILYVELRTASKGKMRIKYEDFNPTQLTCLVRRFPGMAHISECNVDCFGGLLFDANDRVNDDGI
jgi:hypothetical protein